MVVCTTLVSGSSGDFSEAKIQNLTSNRVLDENPVSISQREA